MPDSPLGNFRRYAGLVSAALRGAGAFAPEAEDASAVQVERGTVFPLALTGRLDDAAASGTVGRLIELGTQADAPYRLAALAVVDRAGHHRPAYRPLLVYSWLQAFRLVYETLPRSQFGRWEEGLRPWCDVLESTLMAAPWPAGTVPAARGGAAGEAAWAALALHVAGRVFVRDTWTDLANDAFGNLGRRQTPGGAFLSADGSDNPEAGWHHELVLLHAVASYAAQAEDRNAAAAVKRATEYHSRETQPDHASTQPWALFAFVWNESTRPFADALLHAAAVQAADAPGGVGGVPSLLLGDALYCLRLFVDPPGSG